MTIRVVRLGTPRHPDEGTRIGTVRRPPRGVPKTEYAERDYYDAWLPELAPSPDLMKQGKAVEDQEAWEAFAKKYRSEMAAPEKRRLLELLSALSHGTNFSVGCYCEEESRCHRSLLRELLAEGGADLEAGSS
ncbi:MAG: DUF488 domain-containing protein [Gemmatimonadota bacterium]